MSVIVVVRNNGMQWIFEGPITKGKYQRIRKACSLKVYKNYWGERENQYVLENYRVIPASLIAENLRTLTKKPFTKNMVIRRYHTLRKKKNVAKEIQS